MSTTTSSPLTAATVPAPAPDVEIVVPVHNEEASSSGASGACTPTCPPTSRSRGGSRSSTTRAPTPPGPGRRSPRRPAAGRARRAPRRQGPRRRAAGGVVGERRPRRWRTWTSTCPPTWPRCSPLVAPLLSGHSDLAIGSRLSRGAHGRPRAASARSSRAATTCCCGPRWRRGSPTRSAGSRRSAPTAPATCSRSSRTPAGSSTPSCSCSPSAPACASTRCRSTGSTTRTRGSTSCATASADLRGVARLARGFASGSIPVATLRERLGRAPAAPARGEAGFTTQVLRFAAVGVVSHAGVPAAVRGAARAYGRPRSPTPSRCWSRRSRTPRPTAGSRSACAVAAAAWRHQARGSSAFGFALAVTSGSLALLHVLAPAAGRGLEIDGAGRRQPRRDRAAVPAAAALGLPPPRRRDRPAPPRPARPEHQERVMTVTVPSARGAARRRDRRRRPPPPPVRRAVARAAVARTSRRPRLGAPRAARRCWPAPPSCTCGGSARPGWANSFYSAAVQAGTKSWKAFFFGSFDSVELHHRRQAAGLAVGDGAVGARLRGELVEHPRPAGARRRRVRRPALRGRAATVQPGGRTARRCGAGAHAGRGAHVPVQQPRRAARRSCSSARRTR